MKSFEMIQRLSKIGKALSKIAFIFSIIGFFGCIAALCSMNFGNGSPIKLGKIVLHGLISEEYGSNVKSITAALYGWLVVCAGEAVLAKFAEVYFRNELKAETPFTIDGAKELLRLGILTIAIPKGCAMIGIIVGFRKVEEAVIMNTLFDTGASVGLGIMFLLGSLLCRYGAELKQEQTEDSKET